MTFSRDIQSLKELGQVVRELWVPKVADSNTVPSQWGKSDFGPL